MALTIKFTATNASGGANVGEADWQELFREIITPGAVGRVYPTSLAVSANGTGMFVTVEAGKAVIGGALVTATTTTTVNIASNSSGLGRIDTIVVGVDNSADAPRLTVVQGTPNATPQPPTLTTSMTGIYDVALAYVIVDNAVANIASNKVQTLVTRFADSHQGPAVGVTCSRSGAYTYSNVAGNQNVQWNVQQRAAIPTSMHSTATNPHLITVPTSGWYQVSGYLKSYYNVTGGLATMTVLAGAVTIGETPQITANGATYQWLPFAGAVYLTAGQTVYAYINCGASSYASMSTDAASHLSVAWISS